MAVITALELDDFVAPRVSTRQADRAHRRFGARTHHAQALDRRHEIGDLRGDSRFQHAGSAKAQAPLRGLYNGFEHGRVCVPEDHGSP